MSNSRESGEAAGQRRWLLTLETGANQAYVFASNRLRECVGASHLIACATGAWLDETLAQAPDHTVLQQASGKAYILFEDVARADVRAVVQRLSLRVLRDAPGLELTAAIVAAPDAGAPASEIVEAVRAVNGRVGERRGELPGAAARHPRLPLTADCASTSAGAARLVRRPGRDPTRPVMAVSAAVHAKREVAKDAAKLLAGRASPAHASLPTTLAQIEALFEDDSERLRWLAVVHADVNGLGQVLMNLGADGDQARYLRDLKAFSEAVEAVAAAALRTALQTVHTVEVEGATIVPVLPLIAAGDDLTAVLPAADALRFVVAYLRAFEAESAEHEGIRDLAPGARLAACAGIAVVKPHHPFSDAYALAEHLTDHAKLVKRRVVDAGGKAIPCSAFDYHVLYDSLAGDLADLRAEWIVNGGETVLHNRPYVVTNESALADATPASRQWAGFHAVEELDRLGQALVKPSDEDSTRREIPRGQVLALRELLPRGRAATDERTRIALARTPALDAILTGGSLFRPVPGTAGHATGLLDALDAVELSTQPIVEPAPVSA